MGRPRSFDEDQVVDAAMRLFWRHGFHGTTTRGLVAATGLGQGSLYAAFGGKRKLYERALDRYCELQIGGLEAELADGDVVATLQSVLDRAARPADDVPPGCLLVATATEIAGEDPAAARSVLAAFDRLEAVVRAALERAQAAGELHAGVDIAAAAAHFTVLLQGIRVVSETSPSQRRLQLAARHATVALRA